MKYYNAVTNLGKARICSEIATKINALGVSPRTLTEQLCCTYMRQIYFFEISFFAKDLLVNSSTYLSRDAFQSSSYRYIAYINQKKYIYIPSISCFSLETFFLNLEIVCNYNNTFYVLVTILTFFNWKRTNTSSFMSCFSFNMIMHFKCLCCFLFFFTEIVYLHIAVFMIKQS